MQQFETILLFEIKFCWLIVLTGFQSHLKQDYRLICKYKVPSHLKLNIYGLQVIKRVSKSKQADTFKNNK